LCARSMMLRTILTLRALLVRSNTKDLSISSSPTASRPSCESEE
jgi:hypothetical protein